MQIQVNGKTHQLDATKSIEDLLVYLEMKQQTGIAIAVNDTVIPRDKWAKQQLNNQDNILIITATQGG